MRLIARALPLVVVLAVAVNFVHPHRAATLPLYAARTGLMCQTCHVDPNGGGARNEFGFAYARNRHTIEPDTSGVWKDLNLVNRVSENVPIFFGLDQRIMLLANSTLKTDSLDRLGFYNMENSLSLTFQPHSRLALVYTMDSSPFTGYLLKSKDVFGLISGFPLDGYIKAGRFRNPFGLRMDDHTVATRNAFLDFETGQGFLPYDPRQPDLGVEIGGDRGPVFGRASFTNGASDVFGLTGQPYAETFAGKLGFNRPAYQGAVSIYDDYERSALFPFRRATRWGYYNLTHWRRLALLGEIAAGTDEAAGGAKRNLLAGWVEADYAFNRAYNLRVRYDRFEGDRSDELVTRPDASQVSRRDLDTWNRYALEGEYVPVPFAELRWVVRVIDPKASADRYGQELKPEKQAYLQVHISY